MEFRSSNPRGNIEFRTFLNNGLVGIFTYSGLLTQVGKGNLEGKNDQRIPTSKFVMGMFMLFKIAKNKKLMKPFWR